MSDDLNMMSLADLANIDVSGVDAVRYVQLPAGIFVFEVTDAKMLEGQNDDGDKRFNSDFTLTIREVKSVLESGVDKDSLIGKTHTERQYITPAKGQEETTKAIGRVRAFVEDSGGTWSGNIVESVQNTKGNVFTGKLVHQKDRNDPSRINVRLQLEERK